MVGKGNLAIFESSGISETGKTMPTKLSVHACYINAYLHEFFELILIDQIVMTMDYSPWLEREIWLILRVVVSPKLEGPRPPKLVYMHVTSMITCMNFLIQFRSIKFFDDHGL